MTKTPVDLLSQLDVSRETHGRLQAFADLLVKWNARINLVSKSSLAHLWQRHIVDSVQVYRSAGEFDHWVDLGTGGGFPGMVAAILAHEERPDARISMIESDRRKAGFLRAAKRELDLSCEIIDQRIEAVPPQNAEILSARALADLATLLGYAERHLGTGGVGLFPKGATWKKELADAERKWNFHAEATRSLTEPEAVILKITGVSRV